MRKHRDGILPLCSMNHSDTGFAFHKTDRLRYSVDRKEGKGGQRMKRFSELLDKRKNFVFIGETGSGKSEIALNTAVFLREQTDGSVHVFDLDQTKAMFRARDAEQDMTRLGVTLHYMPQLLDTPVMVNGIIPHLVRKDSRCILDVGGNENAARMVGCLSDYLNRENTAAVYVLNPFRPWSGSTEDICATMNCVLNACHLEEIFFVVNPTVGVETDREDITEGFRLLNSLIPEKEISACFITEALIDDVKHTVPFECYPLHRYLPHPWQVQTSREKE